MQVTLATGTCAKCTQWKALCVLVLPALQPALLPFACVWGHIPCFFVLKENPKITTPASGEFPSLGRLLFGDMFSWRYCHRQHISRLSSSHGLYHSFLPRQCSMLLPYLSQHNCLWVCTMSQMRKLILLNSKKLQKLFCFSNRTKEVPVPPQKNCLAHSKGQHMKMQEYHMPVVP